MKKKWITNDNLICKISKESTLRCEMKYDEIFSSSLLDGTLKSELDDTNYLINIDYFEEEKKIEIINSSIGSDNVFITGNIARVHFNILPIHHFKSAASFENFVSSFDERANIKKSYRRSVSYYTFVKEHYDLEDSYLIECFAGKTLFGSLFSITQQLISEGKKVYIVSDGSDNIYNKIVYYKLNVIVLYRNSYDYLINLARAKYILSDVVMPYYFSIRENQKYYNCWHGTPLKHMGKKVTPTAFKNIQYDWNMSSLISLPNIHSIEKMSTENNIINTSAINILPSPRNDAFFNEHRYNELRNELSISSKQKVIVWLPTWREGKTQDEAIDKNTKIIENMNEVAQRLGDEYVFYLKPHPLAKIINLDSKILYIDDKYQIYDFLCCADILITDYSSIFFDFAILNRKIILDFNDVEDYRKSRGLYDIELPFSIANNNEEMLELILDNKVVDYTAFNNQFSPYDVENGAQINLEKFRNSDYRRNNVRILVADSNTNIFNMHLGEIDVVFFTNDNIKIEYINFLEKQKIKYIYNKNYYLADESSKFLSFGIGDFNQVALANMQCSDWTLVLKNHLSNHLFSQNIIEITYATNNIDLLKISEKKNNIESIFAIQKEQDLVDYYVKYMLSNKKMKLVGGDEFIFNEYEIKQSNTFKLLSHKKNEIAYILASSRASMVVFSFINHDCSLQENTYIENGNLSKINLSSNEIPCFFIKKGENMKNINKMEILYVPLEIGVDTSILKIQNVKSIKDKGMKKLFYYSMANFSENEEVLKKDKLVKKVFKAFKQGYITRNEMLNIFNVKNLNINLIEDYKTSNSRYFENIKQKIRDNIEGVTYNNNYKYLNISLEAEENISGYILVETEENNYLIPLNLTRNKYQITNIVVDGKFTIHNFTKATQCIDLKDERFYTQDQINYNNKYKIESNVIDDIDVYFTLNGSKKPKKLIVTFGNCADYNFSVKYPITYLGGNKELYNENILLAFQDNYFISGTYFMKDDFGNNPTKAIGKKVSMVMKEYNIAPADLVIFASSKGATSAINVFQNYHGSTFILVAPQIKMSNYLNSRVFHKYTLGTYIKDEVDVTKSILKIAQQNNLYYGYGTKDEMCNSGIIEKLGMLENVKLFSREADHGEAMREVNEEAIGILNQHLNI